MWYDVCVLAILIVAMVRGAVRGVVWQLAGIAGIVLCLVFAETISAVGSPYVNLDPPLNQWVVMFVAYLVFSFLSFGVARLIHEAIEKAELKEYNKHLGAVFGLLKGVAFCLVVTFFLVTLSERTRDMLRTSRSARIAAVIMDRLHPMMPDKLRGALARYIRELDADDLDLKHATSNASQANKPGGADEPTLGEPNWEPIGDSGDPTSQNDGSTNPPEGGDAIDEFLRQIPGLSNDYVRTGVREVYEAIPQESREQFLEELKNAGPALMFMVLQRWQSQPPTETTQPVSDTPSPAESRDSLLSAIAVELARTIQERATYEQSISAGIAGLPDTVTMGVLEDWHADITGEVDDPDPQTTAATPLDARIIRQLTIQRVSVFQLSEQLRDRLMRLRQQ